MFFLGVRGGGVPYIYIYISLHIYTHALTQAYLYPERSLVNFESGPSKPQNRSYMMAWRKDSQWNADMYLGEFLLVLKGEWGSENWYHYRGIYGD